jgi:general secretion pathway protein L
MTGSTMPSLVIALPLAALTAQSQLDCVWLNDDGSYEARPGQRLDALKIGGAGQAQAIAVVPVEALSWHKVQLPAGTRKASASRLRAVLEGLLEDQLLDDPAQLHFALQAEPSGSDGVWVAVCERAWLSGALAQLGESGLRVQRIVPHWAPTGSSGQTSSILCVTGTPEMPTLVCVDAQGVRLLPANAASLALVNPDRLGSWQFEAEPAVAAFAEQLLQAPVTVQTRAEQLQRATQTDWNLAQFDMVQAHAGISRATEAGRAFLSGPRFRTARWAALAALLIHLVGLNAWAWTQQRQVDDLRKHINSTLQTTFPQVQVVVDAPLQMQRELATLQRASGQASGRDLEQILASFGAVAPANAAPAAIEFEAGELRLQGLKDLPQQTEALQAALLPQGLAVRADGGALVISPQKRP